MKKTLIGLTALVISLYIGIFFFSLSSDKPLNVVCVKDKDNEEAKREQFIAMSAVLTSGIAETEVVDLSYITVPELKQEIQRLPKNAQLRALQKIKQLPVNDMNSVHVGPNGSIFYTCRSLKHKHVNPSLSAPSVVKSQLVTSTVKPFPILVSQIPQFSSKPGSANILYLCFVGGNVTNTYWNGSIETYNPLPFDRDGTPATFNSEEQTFLIQVWESVAEDFKPFDVNVTTVSPTAAQMATNKVIWCYITPTVDSNGNYLPYAPYAGGVAYFDVFGSADYSQLSPIWNYNIWDMSNCAATVSHEAGHNLGLSHDGTFSSEYYTGHTANGSNSGTNWFPIMGSGIGVSHWSKGEYFNANNFEDDLAIIGTKLNFNFDDNSSFRPCSVSSTGYFANGTIDCNDRIDIFEFKAQTNMITFNSTSSIADGNLGMRLQIMNGGNIPLASSVNGTVGQNITVTCNNLVIGSIYRLAILPIGSGAPTSVTPTGYTSYGSLGSYTITQTSPVSPTPTPTPSPTPALVPVIKTETIHAYAKAFRFLYWLTASNSPTTWKIVSGKLPAGLKFDTKTSCISGIPTVTGTFMFNVTATNRHGTSKPTLIVIKLYRY
jgi:hypothetical protein